MKKRVASTPISSIRSSSVMNSPRRLDIDDALAALDEVHELQQRDLELVGIGAGRRHRGLDARDVAVVVGPQRDDQPLEAALELVLDVGDVGGEVGRVAVGLARSRGPCRRRTRSSAATARPRGGSCGRPARRARRPARSRPSCSARSENQASKCDAVALERRLDALDHQRAARRREVLARRARRHRGSRRQLGDVLALVAVLGQRLAAGAGADRLAEPLQLPAGVVEVVLARRPRGRRTRAAAPARRRTRRGGRWPRSAGRSGWRRRTRGSRARASAAVPPPQSSPAASTCAAAADVPGVGQEDVQEARAGDLDALEPLAEPLAAAPRRAARRSRAAAP